MLIAILACMSLSASGIEALGSPTDLFKAENCREISIEKSCKRGPRGHRGKKGEKGHLGKEGIEGVSEFGEAYLISGPTPSLVPFLTVQPEVVQFTETGPLSRNITYDPSTWTFTVHKTGTYTIEYGAIASTPIFSEFNSSILVLFTELMINGVADGIIITPAVQPILHPPGIDKNDTLKLNPLNTSYTSFVNATNQITRDLTAETTINLRALVTGRFFEVQEPVNQLSTFTPIWGIGVPGEQAVYLSIKKLEEKKC